MKKYLTNKYIIMIIVILLSWLSVGTIILISKNDSQEYYKVFLNNIVKVIKRDYGMFIIGMTKCNSLNKIFSNLRNIHFDSKIYTVDFILGNGKKQEIDRNNIWIECGLL